MFSKLKYLKKIIYSNFGRLESPHKISYVATYKCNLRCRMCNIWRKEPVEELSLAEAEKFFKTSNSFSWVGITGGEPFLRGDIGQLARIILNNCRQLVAIHFATNGSLTAKITETAENILKHKKNTQLLFTLSIDGPPGLHDEIRGVKGAWDNCLNTYKELKKNKNIQARIGITLSSANLTKFKDTFLSLKEAYPKLEFDDININIFSKSSFYYTNQDLPDLDPAVTQAAINEILKMDQDPLTLNNFLRRRYLKLYARYVRLKKCPLNCRALSASCILDPQGDIYPCGIYGVKVGNIREDNYDLKKIWQGGLAKKISGDCFAGRCPSCWSPCDAYSTMAASLFDLNLWRG